MDRSPLVVGIAGGTGSGKTTLANKLKAAIAEDALILSHDFIIVQIRRSRSKSGPKGITTTRMRLIPIK